MTVITAGVTGGIPYETLTLVLDANEIRGVPKTTAYLSILSATSPVNILISFNGASFFVLPPGISISDFLVDQLWIQNSSGAPNTVVLATGIAVFRDNRLVIDAVSPLPVSIAGNQAVNLAQVGGTAIALGDNSDIIVKPFASSASAWQYAPPVSGIVNSTVGVVAKAAAGAGVRNYVTGLTLCSDALTTATEFVINDGAAGTVLFRVKIQTAGMLAPVNFTFPVPLKGTANTLIEIKTLTAAGAAKNVYANLAGYSAP